MGFQLPPKIRARLALWTRRYRRRNAIVSRLLVAAILSVSGIAAMWIAARIALAAAGRASFFSIRLAPAAKNSGARRQNGRKLESTWALLCR
jgi:hypothetical protein